MSFIQVGIKVTRIKFYFNQQLHSQFDEAQIFLVSSILFLRDTVI